MMILPTEELTLLGGYKLVLRNTANATDWKVVSSGRQGDRACGVHVFIGHIIAHSSYTHNELSQIRSERCVVLWKLLYLNGKIAK